MLPFDLEFLRSCINKDDVAFRQFMEGYEGLVIPTLKKIPRVVIHGDFYSGNVLIDKEQEKIIGIIDFGTCGISHPGYDLGIMICHLLGDRHKCKFEDMAEVVAGFCEVHPLSQEEVECLYYMICVRVLFLYKWFDCRSLMEYVMVENGPEYTTRLMKKALSFSKSSG